MTIAWFLSLMFGLTLSSQGPAVSPAQTPSGQVPEFRTGTDLVTIDVQLTPAHGAANRTLGPADFSVEIDGRKRVPGSAALLHEDTGPIVRNLLKPPADDPPCIFGFRRIRDVKTLHYLVGVQAIEKDQRQVKRVNVRMVDKAFEMLTFSWRSPIRHMDPHVGSPAR